MYAKCGALSKGQDVLQNLPSRDVVSWNALITGDTQQCQGEQALNCFEHMQQEGIPPDAVTYACILKACASVVAAIDKGREIHDRISRQGLLQNDIVLGNALVDMYDKCSALSKAQDVLENLPYRVSWSALITGYAREGQGEQALKCFERMQCESIPPNAATYTCVLNSCATIGAADKGKEIHVNISRQGLLDNNIALENALVDMYAKCGALFKAQDVLQQLCSRNIVSWNAVITRYAQEDQSEQALHYLKHMQHEGIPPDAMTYICILNAYAAIGTTNKGKEIHDDILRLGLLQNDIVIGNALVDMNMSTKYGMNPSIECYTCMVDLFGRARHLEKAIRLIQEMPSIDDYAVWLALLGAYR